MSGALIGVVGVIAGALLGGLISFWLERRRRLARAKAAGVLIASELSTICARIDGGLLSRPKRWWTGELPVWMWKDLAKEVASEVPNDLLQQLADQYALVDRLNIDLAQSHVELIDDKRAAALEGERRSIWEAKEKLDGAYKNMHPDELPRPTLISALAAAAVIVTVLLWAAIIQRPHLNAATVAAAVSSTLSNSKNGKIVADCHASGSDWRCVAYNMSSDCAAASRGAAREATTKARRLALASAPAACKSPLTVLNDGDNVDVVSPSEVERGILVKRASISRDDIGKKSWISKLKFW